MTGQIVTDSKLPPIEKEIGRNIRMTYERFPIPNYVKIKSIEAGTMKDLSRFSAASLDGLPEDILDDLVEAMLQEIYAKAGCENPWRKDIEQ